MSKEQGSSKPSDPLEQFPSPDPKAKEDVFNPEYLQWFKCSLEKQIRTYRDLHPDEQLYGIPPDVEVETILELCKMVQEDLLGEWVQQVSEDDIKVDFSQAPKPYVDEVAASIQRAVLYYLASSGELSEYAWFYRIWWMREGVLRHN